MIKRACITLFLGLCLSLRAEPVVEANEVRTQNAIELFKAMMLRGDQIQDVVRILCEQAVETAGKEGNLEKIVSQVSRQVRENSFIQPLVTSYEKLSDAEIAWLLDVYKTDAIGKLQDSTTKLYATFFAALQNEIQEAVQSLEKKSVSAEQSADRIIPIGKGEEFSKEVQESNIPVVMDCYAKWCPPCKKMAPIFYELSQEWMGRVKFVKFDIEANPTLAQELKVKSMPTFLFFKEGKVVGRHVGALPKEELAEKMKSFIF